MRLRGDPVVSVTFSPAHSAMAASSVNSVGWLAALRCASRMGPKAKPCGVCAANSVRRSSVPSANCPSRERLIVSVTGRTPSTVGLTWTRPADDDVTCCTYRVFANGALANVEWTGERSATVLRLSAGTTYAFTVVAVDPSLNASVSDALVVGGDMNVAPADIDVWDAAKVHGGTHVSPAEREAFAELVTWGLVDGYRSKRPEPQRFTWWDYRAGNFHKNLGMRIDHLLLSPSVAERQLSAEIDREARKGVPIPSDHAPLFIDIDEPGVPIDPGWEGALERIAARTKR